MWAILKIDKKYLSLLKRDILSKLGNEVKFYIPKLQLKKFSKKKIFIKEKLLLGDYLFCFHNDFSKNSTITSLKYCRGLKYFLSTFLDCQKEINDFIQKCKTHEDEKCFIRSTFFEFKNKNSFEFISGPFTNMIFEILNENKISIRASMGKYMITVSKEENLFRPV